MSKHVIFVDESFAIGGAEINLLLIASGLARAGWRTTTLIPGDGPLAERLRRSQLPFEYVPRPRFISTSFYLNQRRKLPNPAALPINAILGLVWLCRLASYLRRSGPALVHTMSMWAHAFAAPAARLAGCPVLWHMQDTVSSDAGLGLYRLITRLWARSFPDHILCISPQVAEQFRGDPRVERKLSILPNTIDCNRFAATDAPRHRAPGQKLRIGTVARLTPWKGHEVALRAARELKRRGVCFEWLIAGEESLGNPGYGAHLHKLVVDWGLEDNVQFVGWIEDMPAFYASLDVLAHLPIEPEPFGLGLAEAMASGLAIVASTGGGAEQMVADAGGLLVPMRAEIAAAEALEQLWRAPDEVMARGLTAQAFARRTFSVECYITRLTDLYASLQREERHDHCAT